MTQYIENIDILFSILLYSIVSSKKNQIFRYITISFIYRDSGNTVYQTFIFLLPHYPKMTISKQNDKITKKWFLLLYRIHFP